MGQREPWPVLDTGAWEGRECLCSDTWKGRVHAVKDCPPAGTVRGLLEDKDKKRLVFLISREKRKGQLHRIWLYASEIIRKHQCHHDIEMFADMFVLFFLKP